MNSYKGLREEVQLHLKPSVSSVCRKLRSRHKYGACAASTCGRPRAHSLMLHRWVEEVSSCEKHNIEQPTPWEARSMQGCT